MEAISAINHAPVVHEIEVGEPITPNIKIIGTTAKYEKTCGFIVKKSNLAIFVKPVISLHLLC